MARFSEVYRVLNVAQRMAVDHIDGPLLVTAGPGTGKTQLLSARVANILQKTDTPARNILCLTFTESGAENIRERLSSFIGQAAYEVTVSTYHAFGADLIRHFPEYFTETRLQNPVDELSQRQIVSELVEAMSYANPLKQTKHHLGDLISTLSEVKRALLTADDLRHIANENLRFVEQASHEAAPLLAGFVRMPSVSVAISVFEQLLHVFASCIPDTPTNQALGSLAHIAGTSLQTALEQARDSNKTTTLTSWKNDWLIKDKDNHFVIVGELESRRLRALADLLKHYQAALASRELYDFDDMIIRTIDVLATNDELRFTLQEQYLYLLLDEFQDTNAAQLRLVELLTNNPVNEGRPNVMAVGDDDQAIYAFQGAQYSNLRDFFELYRDVRVINLIDNYRSHPDILYTAEQVARQIQERLYPYFSGSTKLLHPAKTSLPTQADLSRYEFLSDIAQADWIAREIKRLIDQGTPAADIAILAPRHRQLEALVPYLNALQIPVRYEKRENILDAPIVKQLLTMCRLVLALHEGDDGTANQLWPEVLSYGFWQLPISRIWQLAWQVADGQRSISSWSRALLADGSQFRIPALLFLSLATKVNIESCEAMLDYLIGSSTVETNEPDLPKVYSPLKSYYTSPQQRRDQPELFYETISHLTVLRTRLRDHQAMAETALSLQDLIDFVAMYQAAEERMIDTSPYTQQTDAVQVMTVFKAKGLEFAHVFLPNCQDDVWGNTARSQANRLTLPANLTPIRHAGITEDERLRILFVAITRAKIGLHLTSVARNYNGKPTKRLKYFDEQAEDDGSIKTRILPVAKQPVHQEDGTPPPLKLLELDWKARHRTGLQQTDLRALLAPRLNNYRLSPTHMTSFLDLQYGGPERLFFATILRFPEAPTVDEQFGNAIHETLEWLQHQLTEHSVLPSVSDAQGYFGRCMKHKKLTSMRTALEIERGEAALSTYLLERSHTFSTGDRAEVNFRHDNIAIDDIRLSGKVDRLEIDQQHKTITVVDYKTGKSFERWASDAKLHHYQRQLYAYKLLVEHSTRFAGYQVTHGRLEFIEPNQQGRINKLELDFQAAELTRTKLLFAAVWQHVMQLNFPDVSTYDASLTGIRQFEADLLDGNV